MTTLAIIGGGIAGRSLIYALAKQKKNFSKIILFDSQNFARACSLNSTAIVASRGVTRGHSELGDVILEAFETFHEHVQNDGPLGIYKITQYTVVTSKIDQFKSRYPEATLQKEIKPFGFKKENYLSSEEAYLIDTEVYLNWLTEQSFSDSVFIYDDFVTQVGEQKLHTQNGGSYDFDHLVFAGGVSNQNSPFKTVAKSAQGSYLLFSSVDWGEESFSLTFEGDNLIYHGHSKKLLIGSTTLEANHEWPEKKKLHSIYQRIESSLDVSLPAFELGVVKTGLREKAAKRMPYCVTEKNFSRVGGFYKNGYSFGLYFGNKLAQRLTLRNSSRH